MFHTASTHFNDGACAVASSNDIQKIRKGIHSLGCRTGNPFKPQALPDPSALASELQAAFKGIESKGRRGASPQCKSVTAHRLQGRKAGGNLCGIQLHTARQIYGIGGILKAWGS